MSQRVLITAGAAGIGREFARAFAANGAKVFVCDIDEKSLAATAKEIPGITARRYDIGSRAEIERMVPEAVGVLGGLDVLINNAGIAGLTLPIVDYPPDDWDKVVAVNLTAMFDVSRLAIPHLKKSKAGCIINMSSIVALRALPGRDCYTAAKGAVAAMTRSMAVEYAADKIRVNAIAPGVVLTERVKKLLEGSKDIEKLAATHLLGLGLPIHMADMAVYLASDESAITTGQVISVDSGATIR